MATSIAAAAPSFSVSGEKPTMSSPTITEVDTAVRNHDAPAANSGARILELHEWKEAALGLAEAFVDDEVSNYFLNTPERATWTKEQKWELHVKIMEYITYAHLLRGLVVSAGPNYDCVALW